MRPAAPLCITVFCLAIAPACTDTPRYASADSSGGGVGRGADASTDRVSDASGSGDVRPNDAAPDRVPDAAADTPPPPDVSDPAPCVAISETEIAFGDVALGATVSRTLTLRSCAEIPVQIQAISLGRDTSPAFTIEPSLERPGRTLGPGSTLDIEVRFAPGTEAGHVGAVLIATSDPDSTTLQVSLYGAGRTGCAEAVAVARARGSDGPWTTEVQAPTASTIELDASRSTAPPGTMIVDYSWAIVQRPAGSNGSLMPSNRLATPALLIDTPGRYTLELTVRDSRGQPGCNTARITIVTTVEPGIQIQVNWTSDGADVDLHFLHPRGRWDASPHDCYWLNPSPNWAVLDSADDDPSLDIDDVDGFGPERISLRQPEPLMYSVGAHYFSDHNSEEPNALTARIWLNGSLTFVSEGPIVAQGQFWDIARIEWGPEPRVIVINRVYDDIP